MSDEGKPLWVHRLTGTIADHWLDVIDPDGWREASIKWDGCIHYTRYFNQPGTDPDRSPDDVDCLHICDIDDEIARLQALKAAALAHFGDDWPRI